MIFAQLSEPNEWFKVNAHYLKYAQPALLPSSNNITGPCSDGLFFVRPTICSASSNYFLFISMGALPVGCFREGKTNEAHIATDKRKSR